MYNTLGEWSDSDDDWIWDVEEKKNSLGEWSDSDDDWIRDVKETVQVGRGRKRKSDEINEGATTSSVSNEVNEGVSTSSPLPEDIFYVVEKVNQVNSKKFRMSAKDYLIRFNNTESELDLIEGYERTQEIFEHLLNNITGGMNEKDQVRFVLRSAQLKTPISLPFMPVLQLTPERVFSQIERVVQSNQDFRLNDTVTVDIIHVETPRGSGRKRIHLDIEEFLKNKDSLVRTQNKDDLCLARALVVAIAKIEKDPKYKSLVDSRRPCQTDAAYKLHEAANVPLGPCGIAEVQMFQKYLTCYEINIISKDHNIATIFPSTPTKPLISKVKPIYLYLHNNHYDVITSMPGFLGNSYFCHNCKRSYDHATDHLCPNMCKSCRSLNCTVKDPRECIQCNRMFKSKECYDRHKEPIGDGKSVCEAIKKCKKCGKSLSVRHLDPEKHVCGKKCSTCGVIVNGEDTHNCYIQKPKKKDEEESQYSELLFFDYECTQEEKGIHKPNLCIIHNEAGDEWIFKGKNTNEEFCKWLFSKEHQGCIVVAHNFQGYDGYFIQNFLNKNGVKYDIILRGAKILSMTIPMFNIKFIDSLNFIPMSLAKFPQTFGMEELCKGYFPHLFNREEHEDYVGPIPSESFYSPNSMKPETRKAFRAWYKEQVDNNYVFTFNEELIDYCRSDVDILRKCCMEFREMFREITDIDPFEKCLTIASACHEVFHNNFLKEETIAVFNSDRYLKMNQSNTAIKWLSYMMRENNIRIEHVRNGGEKRVGKYSVDGYCEEYHTVYEFQGCFWHGKLRTKLLGMLNGSTHVLFFVGCLNCYARDTINPVNGKTMQQLHEDTLEKICYLKEQGFHVVEMWECELKKEMERDEDMKRYFEEHELVDPLQPRDAFFGGRTNAAKLFHECKEDEEIR